MKIAIPVAEGLLCAHFGHCERFSIVELDESGTVGTIREEIPPAHEPGVLPAWLKSLEVTHIIAGGMGGRAQGLFQSIRHHGDNRRPQSGAHRTRTTVCRGNAGQRR